MLEHVDAVASGARWWPGRARSPRPRRACSRPPRCPSTSTSSAASLDSRSGAKPPSSPTAVLSPRSCSIFLSAWKTSAPVRSASAKVGAPTGHDHELLEVDGVVGVRAAVEDVHHRHRQHVRGLAAEVAPQRQPASAAAAFAAASDTPRIALAPRRPLLGVPSSVDHRAVDRRLVARRRARDRRGELAVDVGHRLGHALAAAALAAVAQLDGLVLAGGRAGRHRGAAAARPSRASPRPRPWGCRGCRGSAGRGPARSRSLLCSRLLCSIDVPVRRGPQRQLGVGARARPRPRPRRTAARRPLRSARRGPRRRAGTARRRPPRQRGRASAGAPARRWTFLASSVEGSDSGRSPNGSRRPRSRT